MDLKIWIQENHIQPILESFHGRLFRRVKFVLIENIFGRITDTKFSFCFLLSNRAILCQMKMFNGQFEMCVIHVELSRGVDNLLFMYYAFCTTI